MILTTKFRSDETILSPDKEKCLIYEDLGTVVMGWCKSSNLEFECIDVNLFLYIVYFPRNEKVCLLVNIA